MLGHRRFLTTSALFHHQLVIVASVADLACHFHIYRPDVTCRLPIYCGILPRYALKYSPTQVRTWGMESLIFLASTYPVPALLTLHTYMHIWFRNGLNGV